MMQHNHVLQAQLMGFVHAMKTGNPTFDMFLAFLVPIVMTQLTAYAKQLAKWMLSKNKTPKKLFCTRTITYHSMMNYNNNGANVDKTRDHTIFT